MMFSVRPISVHRACTAAMISVVAGCATAGPPAIGPAAAPAMAAPEVVPDPRYEAIGDSIEGRTIAAVTHGGGPVRILLLASIHGNEPAGTPLLRALDAWLAEHPEAVAGRTVAIIPVANPDGLATNDRRNRSGVDLNRNFPATNRTDSVRHGAGALSEPESEALAAFITAFTPDRALSIHQPLACVDYDGPGRAYASAIASACGLPVRKLGARPGSLGSWLGETLGLPIVTLELPADATAMDAETLWRRYGAAVRVAVTWEPEGTAEPGAEAGN